MYVLLSLVFAVAPAEAPPPAPTLEALQEAARAASPALRAARLREVAWGQQAEAAGALPSPELGLQVWRPPLDQPWNLYEAGMAMVTLSQRFPGWGVRGAREEALQAMALVETAKGAEWALELDRQVAHAFADYREAQARHAVHAAHLEVLGRIAEVAEARVASGGKLDDVTQAGRERAKLQADVAAESAGIHRAAARLNALTGRASTAPLGTVESRPSQTVSVSLETLLAAAHAARPETHAAESLRRQQSADARAAQQEALAPAVSVGLSYFPPLRTAPAHGLGLSVGVELPWLWGGKAAMRAGEETRVEAAREMVADVDWRLRVEVASALAAVQEATVRLAALERTAQPAAERAFDTAFASYRSGQGDVMTVLGAQKAIVELRVAVVEARAALDHALAELDWAVGGTAPRAAVDAP